MHTLPLLAVTASLLLLRPAAPQDGPNVLFLISDDLTAEALSCYGNEQCQTPAIDSLAERGVRFTRAYCQFPVCGPSRACLMSGMYPQAIGVTGNGGARRFTDNLGDRPSMTQLFREAGWYTARVSKIFHMRVPGDITAGVDGPDHAPSWTERFNCKAPEWMTEGSAELPTDQKVKFDPDGHYNLGFGTAFYVVRGDGDGTEQADHQAATKAAELLGQMGDRRFFLAVGLVRPHVPLVAPDSFFAPYPSADIDLRPAVDDDRADIPKAGISLSSDRIGLQDDDRKRRVLSAYYAAVSFMDAQVGRVLDALDAHGLRDDTIVVFTSDHGYHLGEHDFWQKLSLHEESARIPLLVAGPGLDPATTSALAQQIDIYPTLAELAGLPIPEHVQGRSLAPALADPEAVVHDAVYGYRGTGHLLRTERWAFLSWKDGSAELYDMERDPRQFANLADAPDHADVRAELEEALAQKLATILP